MKGGFHRKDQIEAGVITHLTKPERKRIQRGEDFIFPVSKGFSTTPQRVNRHGYPQAHQAQGLAEGGAEVSAERIADIIDRWKLLPSKNGGPRADSLELAGMILAEGEITAAIGNQFADPKREELLRLAGNLDELANALARQWLPDEAAKKFGEYLRAYYAAIIAEVDRVSGMKAPEWDEEQEHKAFAEAEWTVFQKDAPDMSRENGTYKNPRVYEDWLLWCVARGAGK